MTWAPRTGSELRAGGVARAVPAGEPAATGAVWGAGRAAEAGLRDGGRNEQAGPLPSHPQHPGLRGTWLRGLSPLAASPLTPVGDFVRGSSPLTGLPGWLRW